MQLEAEVTDGNAIADSDISEGCVVEYARHFAIDNIQDCDFEQKRARFDYGVKISFLYSKKALGPRVPIYYNNLAILYSLYNQLAYVI